LNKIIVKHSRIEINNYELGDCTKLEHIFSVYDRLRHIRYPKAIEYNKEEKKLIIPRGVDVYYIEYLFQERAYIDSKSDEYSMVEESKIKYLPRDDVQQETLKFMIGSSVKYKDNKYKSQLAVNLSTGKGKSYCSIATICLLKIKSIIITSSVNVINQWKNYILEYTDINIKDILVLSGTASINRIYKKDISNYKIILCTHGTLRSYGETYEWSKVTELFKYLKIGLKFYDECHLDFDNMCKIDYNTNTYRTYYITATKARSNQDENNIYQLYMKNIPSISLFNPEEDPHTHYISILFNSHPTAYDISECKNQYGLDRNKYTNYVVNKPNFYKVVALVIDLALKHNGKTLIYIGTNNAIEVIYNWIILHYPYLQNHIGIYTSKTTGDKSLQLEKKIILSTTKSCGAAMDIKGLKMTIVLNEPFKSEVLAKQTLGRTRDNNTYYIEVVDIGFYQIKRFYQYKKNIFSEYALDCKEIVIQDDDLERVEIPNGMKLCTFNDYKKKKLCTFINNNEKTKLCTFKI